MTLNKPTKKPFRINYMASVIHYLRVIWKEFIALIYPPCCVGCMIVLVKNESYLCTRCLLNLPYFDSSPDQNRRSLIFSFLPKEVSVQVYLVFNKKGLAQAILYGFKYRGNKALAVLMGRYFGTSLVLKRTQTDYLIPIPLHSDKEQKRGSNQSREIARGLSEKTGIPIKDDVILRIRQDKSQSKQDRIARWQNQKEVYAGLKLDALKGKSVIVVDDVITIGATMVAVCELIAPKVRKITILALAMGK